jgi:hypothetical protein
MTIAERIIGFNNKLDYRGKLPPGIRIMNPFKESAEALHLSEQFYRKYYSDNKPRRFIIGINPGRHGAGITGVPFTDTKRMESSCGISVKGFKSHELSSVFIYEVIDAFEGPRKFYNKYYINSGCPLGFVKTNDKGREVNYNYYDDSQLYYLLKPFMIESIEKQLAIGLKRDIAYCLGTGKNFKYLSEINSEANFFGKIIAIEHPRYIMQYKTSNKQEYIDKYIHMLDY